MFKLYHKIYKFFWLVALFSQSLFACGQSKNEKLLLNFLDAFYQAEYNLEASETSLGKNTKEHFEEIYRIYLIGKYREAFKKDISFFILTKKDIDNNIPHALEAYDIVVNQDTIKGIHIIREGEKNKIHLTKYQVFQLFNVDKNIRNRVLSYFELRPSFAFESALKWFEWSLPFETAEMNDMYAHYLLMHSLPGTAPDLFDYDDVFKHALLSLNQGNKNALFTLKRWVLTNPTPEREEAFLAVCEPEAEKGNIEAMYILAKYYNSPEISNVDIERCIYWYTECFKAAPLYGPPNYKPSLKMICIERLSAVYRNGTGVEKNLEKAADWLYRGAEAGYYELYIDAGLMYLKISDIKARKSFEEAIEHELPTGYLRLSIMIEKGLGGFEKDKEKAERYEKAYKLLLDCPDCWEEAEKIANGN